HGGPSRGGRRRGQRPEREEQDGLTREPDQQRRAVSGRPREQDDVPRQHGHAARAERPRGQQRLEGVRPSVAPRHEQRGGGLERLAPSGTDRPDQERHEQKRGDHGEQRERAARRRPRTAAEKAQQRQGGEREQRGLQPARARQAAQPRPGQHPEGEREERHGPPRRAHHEQPRQGQKRGQGGGGARVGGERL